MSVCKVLLDDILYSSHTRNRPASHQQAWNCLYSISMKDPIAWSNMKKSDKWCDLENDVISLLVAAPTIDDRICLLNESVC